MSSRDGCRLTPCALFRRPPLAALLLLVLLACGSGAAAASERAEFSVEPAGEELFLGAPPGGGGVVPGPGQVALFGRFDRLKIDDLSQVRLLGPDGRPLPLLVEESSLFLEFGKIVAFRFCALAAAAVAGAGQGPLVLEWGPDVKAEGNRKVAGISADPARREAYRSLRSEAPKASTARIEVIADSTADYHFLWYLLPMALVFALLIMGKVRARGPGNSAVA